jgi:hypothetical protein
MVPILAYPLRLICGGLEGQPLAQRFLGLATIPDLRPRAPSALLPPQQEGTHAYEVEANQSAFWAMDVAHRDAWYQVRWTLS